MMKRGNKGILALGQREGQGIMRVVSGASRLVEQLGGAAIDQPAVRFSSPHPGLGFVFPTICHSCILYCGLACPETYSIYIHDGST